MRHRALHVANWVLTRLVSAEQREPLIGDLAEEYLRRANEAAPSAALRWYVRQIWVSAPSLLWPRLRPTAGRVGVALLAYVAVGIAELSVNRVVSGPVVTYDPVALLIMFPAVALIGYVAERYRRGAAFVLGAMMLLMVAAMTAWSAESPPTWYRIAYFFVGPAGAAIGGVLRSLRSARVAHSGGP